jgi:succinylarginine dihydrolase
MNSTSKKPAAFSHEANFDGLVGLTHTYAGLSYGNIASMNHRALISNPREAALQGLTKAKALADLGFRQGIIPPQERPDMSALRHLGFQGNDAAVLSEAQKKAPELLTACSSASSMWTANAATVSPSIDSLDGKVHFTAANLTQKFHRSIEHPTTTRLLKAIFKDEGCFTHHEALQSSDTLGDEGAANHTRFCDDYTKSGLQFFVYGRVALQSAGGMGPKLFPARQTREASESIARLHRLKPENTIFGQQNPVSIDGGAFHNDVVSVGNQNVLFYHEHAFLDSANLVSQLREKYEKLCGSAFAPVEVKATQVSLQDAVKSYLFNSQLITLAPGKMLLVAPQECQEIESTRAYLSELLASGRTPIREVRYFDLRQSMQNGGGPACLRLRVVLNDDESSRANPHVWMNDQTFLSLSTWVKKHYRDRLAPSDLADPKLLDENRTALDELTQLLHLGSVYPFQL